MMLPIFGYRPSAVAAYPLWLEKSSGMTLRSENSKNAKITMISA
jgi:hypothetical protein